MTEPSKEVKPFHYPKKEPPPPRKIIERSGNTSDPNDKSEAKGDEKDGLFEDQISEEKKEGA